MTEKNPETCKKSICFQGIYLCRLELLPCGAVEKCALEKLEDMVNAASSFIHKRRTSQKKGACMVGDPHDGGQMPDADIKS